MTHTPKACRHLTPVVAYHMYLVEAKLKKIVWQERCDCPSTPLVQYYCYITAKIKVFKYKDGSHHTMLTSV